MFIIGYAGPDVKPRTSRLEANILEDGEVREPIVVWGDTIIDGHIRWKIIQAHPEILFKVKQMNFADKWDAISWMCRNQLGRRNLTDEQRAYLIGKQSEAEKMVEKFRGNQYVEVGRSDSDQPKHGKQCNALQTNTGLDMERLHGRRALQGVLISQKLLPPA